MFKVNFFNNQAEFDLLNPAILFLFPHIQSILFQHLIPCQSYFISSDPDNLILLYYFYLQLMYSLVSSQTFLFLSYPFNRFEFTFILIPHIQ
jgi:hypothetical protein